MNNIIDKIFNDTEVKSTDSQSKLLPMSLSELMTKEYPDTEWIVDQLLPSESIIAISGAPASFKTWLMLDIAIRVATGDILFDKFVSSKCGVLLVDEENTERLLQKRFQKLYKNFDLPIHILTLNGLKLTKETVAELVSICIQGGKKLIIFDSLVRIHSQDENDATSMAKVFSLLKEFTKQNITVVFTHHNRKQGILRSNPSQEMRGSSDILASVDCHIAIERKDEQIIITQTKLRQGEEMKPFKLNIIKDGDDLGFEYSGEVDEVLSKKADFKEAIKDLLEQEEKPMYKKELFDTLKRTGIEGGYSTFKTAVQELIDKGELYEHRAEKNKVFCSLKAIEQNNLPLENDDETIG